MTIVEAHRHSPDCPISCLKELLSSHAYIPLYRSGRFNTIADVIGHHQQDKLGDIENIGQRRIGEIGSVLDSIETGCEQVTELADLYALFKLKVTSDEPMTENRLLTLVRESVPALFEDLYIDTDNGATLHIDIDNQWWLDQQALTG